MGFDAHGTGGKQQHGLCNRRFARGLQPIQTAGNEKLRAGDILLVCGDFGFIWDNSKQERAVLKKLSEKKYTIAFVDGCHENFDLLQQYRLVRWRGGVARLIAPNIFHLQRGEIYTIENQKYFAFGGGHSQDYEYRRDTGNWWRQEQRPMTRFGEPFAT